MMNKGIIKCSLFLLAMASTFAADTLWVEYHDFSNAHPDFGAPGDPQPEYVCTGEWEPITGIVQPILPADKVPLLTTDPLSPQAVSATGPAGWNPEVEEAECLTMDIKSWFDPQPGDPGYNKTVKGFIVDQGSPTDTLFEFTGQGQCGNSNHVYPLDALAGAQMHCPYGDCHNMLFCMEMHVQFPYFGGEVFDFKGDDDVWVFINNKLAMDLGGLHHAYTAAVDLDAQASSLGISVGGTYDFDFYYCDRQYSGSQMQVTTNIQFGAKRKRLNYQIYK